MNVHGKIKRSHDRVEHELRQSIVRGLFAPGSQLPKREEIESRFGVGMPTVQKALDALIKDGFVSAKAGSGTFVSARPPHLYRYGLVFPDPSFGSRFYASLKRAAQVASRELGIGITHYFHHDEKDHARLSDDVANYRLAGVVFVHPQWDLWDSLAVRTPGVPRVIIAGETGHGIPAVDVDMGSFYMQAVARLKAEGCRKVAALIPEHGTVNNQLFAKALDAHGLEKRGYWNCTVAANMGHTPVLTTTGLLMELSEEKRPDGLIIADDNMMESALSGLMASSVRVPEQLKVVTHCNYPGPVGEGLPVIRLGFDCQRFIDMAMEKIALQRRGEGFSLVTRVEPVFEESLKAVKAGSGV
jgi:DNA-binding LacI/PurR family transcriptional regulator